MPLTKKHITWSGIAVIVLFLVTSGVLAYFSPYSDPVTDSFRKIYPAAVVGGKLVSIAEANEFITLAQKTDSTVTKHTAYETFLERKKSEALLAKLDVKLQPDAVADELTFYKTGNEAAYDELIRSYFSGKEGLFVDNVVFPEVVEAGLRIKYNSDFALNKDAYQKAQNVIKDLNSGKSFDEEARLYSDDKQSAQLGGDMGFLSRGQILPELEKQIDGMQAGRLSDIIVSRSGYHIVELIETSDQNGTKLWHTQQILIQTTGFEQWLAQKVSAVKVSKIKSY